MENTSNRKNIIYLLAILLLAACASKKKVVPPPVVVQKIDTAIHNPTASDLLDFTLKPWTYFSSKIDVDFQQENGKKISPNVSIRMYKDSLIWLSAGMAGFEGFRILINNDSVIMLNKLERKYYIYKTKEFKGLTDVALTVSQIQNIILAKPIFALKLYKILTQNETQLDIQYAQKKFNTNHSYKKSSYTIDSSQIVDNINPNFARIKYTEYSVIGVHNFPVKTNIESKLNNKLNTIDLKYSDVDFETILSFPIVIPSSYEKAN